MDHIYDVLIVGMGPSGSTLATLLARLGWRVAAVEKSEFPRNKVCGEYLSPSNLTVFKALGLDKDFLAAAGPEVRRTGVLAKSVEVISDMPATTYDGVKTYGRALRREVLDELLLQRAVSEGIDLWQPWLAGDLTRDNATFTTILRHARSRETREIHSRLVVAAHGSWEVGTFPTQQRTEPVSDADLIGVKAHFRDSKLPADLMPMLVFDGGYGGMVTCDSGLTSLSCCIRRGMVKTIRERHKTENIGVAVLEHVMEQCASARSFLGSATEVGGWLTTAVVRPGLRQRRTNGVLLVGNAAGESHPIIAEGISMAMQSAVLLGKCLSKLDPRSLDQAAIEQVYSEYNSAWLRRFRPRVIASMAFAKFAMSRWTHAALAPTFRAFPGLVSLGARISGKVMPINIDGKLAAREYKPV